MGVQNFDVEFEDYIIFHRGVQEVFIDPDTNHLCVTYQDGYVQDLGDPLGDRVDQATTAGQYAAQVEQTIRNKESEINAKLDSATQLSTAANTAYQGTIAIGAEVREGKKYVDEKIATLFEDSVDGISKDDDTGKYYVDLADYSTTNGVKSIVDKGIMNIENVEYYTDEHGERKYYMNMLQEDSRVTNTINGIINDKLVGVDGISYNTNTEHYEVDLSNNLITLADIRTLLG